MGGGGWGGLHKSVGGGWGVAGTFIRDLRNSSNQVIS